MSTCAPSSALDGMSPDQEGFVDLGADGKRDPDAKGRLDKLKAAIQDHVGEAKVGRFRVPWRGHDVSEADLRQFCEQAWKQLSEVVERQIAALTKVSAGELEEQGHEHFGEERCRRFVGRGKPLARIASYLRDGADKPLAVVGPSGSGKSAVMARAVQTAGKEQSEAQIIARYIGATPASSDLIQLLRNLVEEIRRRYPAPEAKKPQSGGGGSPKLSDVEIPIELNPLLSAFHEAMQRPTSDRPLWIFIDALDQLTASHQAHRLTWLPAKLSDHVRLVVSAALPPVEGSAPDSSDPRMRSLPPSGRGWRPSSASRSLR